MVGAENEIKLLVIVVVYNGMRWLNKCLPSVNNSTVKGDLFIVDNGSTDGSIQYIKDNYPEAVFHISDENLGFGKANNLGLQYAIDKGYDYVYLLNQDAWVENDTFAKLISFSVKHPEYGILSPIHCNREKLQIDRNFIEYAIPQSMISDGVLGKLQLFYDTQFVMAAHWMITSACLKKTGGFSPTFPHYGEDNNYLQRVIFQGFKIAIITTIKVVHDRALRNNTKTKSEYMMYIHELVNLSNIFNPNSLRLLIKTSLKSIFPKRGIKFKYLIKLILSYPSIIRNKEISKRTGAFLIHE